MLGKMSFKNYKAFKTKQTIDLGKITVLVGPNSAGKSSIIKLLGLLKQSISHKPSGHHLLNIRGQIVDLIDFESISYRKESKDIEIELRSNFLSVGNDYRRVDNLDNRITINISDVIGETKIKHELETLPEIKWKPKQKTVPKKIILSDKYVDNGSGGDVFTSQELYGIQDQVLRLFHKHLSKIIFKQLGKPGFYKNKKDLDIFLKSRIRSKIYFRLYADGLIPTLNKEKNTYSLVSEDIDSMHRNPKNDVKIRSYQKEFYNLFKIKKGHENYIKKSKTSRTLLKTQIVGDASFIEFPFQFYYTSVDGGDIFFMSKYPVKNVVFEKKKSLKDYFKAINEHYKDISEFVDDKKYTNYVSMQISAYIDVIIENLSELLYISYGGEEKAWNDIKKRVETRVESLSANLLSCFKSMDFSESIRPHPKKFQSRQELKNNYFVTPETDLNKWNKVLEDMGFNYEIFIENVSDSHNLFAIKLRDKMTQVESYLDEVGYGFSQFLPYLGKKFGPGKTLHILEQPELHLHPSSQARLPQQLVKSYHEDAGKPIPQEFYENMDDMLDILVVEEKDGKLQLTNELVHSGGSSKYSIIDTNKYLIETHSEHIVRGIQLLVAKGFLSPSAVNIYYVGKYKNGNSYVKLHELDEKGKFKEKWPEGFFETGFNQAIELLKYHGK